MLRRCRSIKNTGRQANRELLAPCSSSCICCWQGFLRSFEGLDRYQRNTFISDNVERALVVRSPPYLLFPIFPTAWHCALKSPSRNLVLTRRKFLLQTVERIRMEDRGTAVIWWQLQVLAPFGLCLAVTRLALLPD